MRRPAVENVIADLRRLFEHIGPGWGYIDRVEMRGAPGFRTELDIAIDDFVGELGCATPRTFDFRFAHGAVASKRELANRMRQIRSLIDDAANRFRKILVARPL